MATLAEVQQAQTDAATAVAKVGTDLDAFIADNSGGASATDLDGIKAGFQAIGASAAAIDAKLVPPTPPVAG